MAMRDKIEHAIQNQPCTVKDLKNKFGGDRGADRKVMEAVDQLVHEAVICQRQGVFFTVRSGRADKALLCKVVKLGKNFAFVMLEDGTSDIFIPGRFTRGAMPGDKVLVEKFAHPRVEGSDEGEILAVLEEKNSLVGTMHRMEGRLKFVPDDCPAISMQVMRDCEGSAKDGDKVAVEILLRGSRQEDHRVGVAMRFGSCDEAKRCAKALLYAQDIRNRFPDKVRDEAKKLDNAEVSAADCEGRMDLRALPIFTIDSAETKDIDDAISLTKTPDGGFELGVHIADVSNYVKPGSELDNEAFNRATSVYYADQVVPMLPKQLSNGICSLNEGVLRLAFSCLMRLDKDGNLTDYRFVKSVIRSRVKGVYSEINALLAGTADAEIKAKYAIPRRTQIHNYGTVVVKKAEVVATDVAVLLDRFYYIKVVDANVYEKNIDQITKDYRFAVKCQNLDRIAVFADNNQVYTIKVADIIKLQAKKNTSKKGGGSLIGRLADKGIQVFEFCNMNGDENILFMDCIEHFVTDKLLFVSKQGLAKVVDGSAFDTTRRAANASKVGDDIIYIGKISEGDFIIAQSEKGYYIRVDAAEIPEKGKGAAGVKLINLEGDDVLESVFVGSTKDTFKVGDNEIIFTRVKPGKRGGKGSKLRF